jgi:hypothetical protein
MTRTAQPEARRKRPGLPVRPPGLTVLVAIRLCGPPTDSESDLAAAARAGGKLESLTRMVADTTANERD